MDAPDRTNPSQRLKAALWFSIGKMVDQESLQRNRNATPQFIGALTDMVWHQIGKLFLSLSLSLLPSLPSASGSPNLIPAIWQSNTIPQKTWRQT